MRTIRTPKKRAAFLLALSQTCNATKAAEAADIGRMSVYEWRKDDPEFAQAWDDALQLAVEACEDEAHRRAFEGCEKSVYYEGKPCGMMREYSDTLAIFLLKAHKPEKYRDRVDATMRGSMAVTLSNADADA